MAQATPTLEQALATAAERLRASAVTVRGDRFDTPTTTYKADQGALLREAYVAAGKDPATIPPGANLQSYMETVARANTDGNKGVTASPERVLQITADLNTRNGPIPATYGHGLDWAAHAIANNLTDDQIQAYNADQGTSGIVFNDLRNAALVAMTAGVASGMAGGAAAGTGAGGAAATGAGATSLGAVPALEGVSYGLAGGTGTLGAATAAGTATGMTGAGLAAGGLTAAAPTAAGLAGVLGMSPGMAATALNTGAMNAGVTLARGGNIGEALKSGATAAVFSGVGGWAKDLAAPVIGNTAASVASGAATGALGAAVTGGDWKKGLVNGAISSGINEASKAVGGWARTETADMGRGISNAAGNVAAVGTNTVLRGGDLGQAAKGLATTYAGKEVNDYVKETTGSDLAGSVAQDVTTSAISGKTKLNGVSSLLDSYSEKKQPASVYKKSGVADPMARVNAGLATT